MDKALLFGLAKTKARVALKDLRGLTSQNSQMFHILLDGYHNAKLKGLKVTAQHR
ncbi:hypothetical protein RND71_035483 [Anisodus tanguticus]|uniref:Uncharacterized protein n=1 Tax=Anisodus tanguticus TaxID=243964 RepID=A0AAE1UVW1_9SOLA|nr:hypothetical protein RND71_035483 [Anisodus tanguticus]